MTYVVLDNCIKCKFTDCVVPCPVDCFYEGANMLVIDPEVCTDCGLCEPECPAKAIKPDTAKNLGIFPKLNADMAKDLAQSHSQTGCHAGSRGILRQGE